MASRAEEQSLPLDIPNAKLIYTRENGKRQAIYISPGKEDVDEEANVVIEKYIRDGRKSKPSPTLAEHGFQLVPHSTSLSENDFFINENDIIEKEYYREMVDVVKKVCPAAVEVIPFHHMVRIIFTFLTSLLNSLGVLHKTIFRYIKENCRYLYNTKDFK